MQVIMKAPRQAWGWGGLIGAALAAAWLAVGMHRPGAEAPPAAAVAPAVPVLPFAFERNLGQVDAAVDFVSRGRDYALFVTPHEAVLRLRDGGAPLRLRWLGAAAAPAARAERPLAGVRNVLHGADPAAWRSAVPAYGRVRYAGVYPGIDLVYYGSEGRLEYDWVVAAGVDPAVIRMAVAGADAITVDARGALRMQAGDRVLELAPPVIYQATPTGRRTVAGGYRLYGGAEVGFWLGDYDARLPLVIDPVLVYSGYFGGGAAERAGGVAVDGDGNVYLTGETASADFPVTAGAARSVNSGGSDAYVAKFTAAGVPVYVTYLGGAGSDRGYDVAVDAAGNAYLTGTTDSLDFPLVNPRQPGYGGNIDAFVAALDAAGAALLFSTYHGGSAQESANAIAVDATGTVYVGGGTLSANFPVTAGVFQPSFASVPNDSNITEADGYVSAFSAAGALVYSSYLGGSDGESVFALAPAPTPGELVVAGGTKSDDFPKTIPVVQPLFGGFPEDGFVARISADGTTLLTSTYFGGSGWDSVQALAVGSTGTMYVAGVTASTDLTVSANAAQRSYGGGRSDGFVAAISAAGDTLSYASYLGGSGLDQVNAIALPAGGGIVLAGETASADFPLQRALQSARLGAQDGFVTRLDAAGALAWSSYWGGSGDDAVVGLAAGGDLVHAAGNSSSADFPVLDIAQAALRGDSDVFLLGLDLADDRSADLALALADRADPVAINSQVEYDVTVTNLGPELARGVSLRSELPDGYALVAAAPAQGSCTGTTVLSCELGDIAAGAAVQVALALQAREGGVQGLTVSVQRSHQSDPAADNNRVSETTTVTVGHGGGAVGPYSLFALGLLLLLRRRRRIF